MFLYGSLYHHFGFNVTYIVPKMNKSNYISAKYKMPTNDCKNYHFKRQLFEELLTYNWDEAAGIGAVMGFGKLRTLDFDECNDYDFIREVLRLLRLPKDYEWVSKTGSDNGYHIYLLAEEHQFPTKENRTKAFSPNSEFEDKFYRLELRWQGHVVMPPSLSESNHFYKFVNCELPVSPPRYLDMENIDNLLFHIAYENGGFNLNLKDPVDEIEYNHSGFLDFSPVMVDPVMVRRYLD